MKEHQQATYLNNTETKYYILLIKRHLRIEPIVFRLFVIMFVFEIIRNFLSCQKQTDN